MTRWCAVVAVVALGAACDEEASDPRTLLDEPRILGVRSTPPALGIDSVAALEALVVDAGGAERAVEIAWRACDPWTFLIEPDADCGPDASIELDGTLRVQDVLRRFPPPDGDAVVFPADDAPIWEAPVVAEAVVDGRRLVSVKRIAVGLVEPDHVNPVLGAPRFDGQPAAASVAVGAELELGITALAEVPVRVFLYTTGGELADAQLDLVYGPDGSESAELTTWTATEAGAATLWFVGVDDEGGADWRSHRVVVR